MDDVEVSGKGTVAEPWAVNFVTTDPVELLTVTTGGQLPGHGVVYTRPVLQQGTDRHIANSRQSILIPPSATAIRFKDGLSSVDYTFKQDIVWIEGAVGATFSLKFGKHGPDSEDNKNTAGSPDPERVTLTGDAHHQRSSNPTRIALATRDRCELGCQVPYRMLPAPSSRTSTSSPDFRRNMQT